MAKCIRLLFLFLSLECLCQAGDVLIKKAVYKDKEYDLPGYDLKEIEREYREQDRYIYRPCPVYDLLCIRRYLAKHSQCKIAEGPVPDPLYRSQSNLYLPNFGISITQTSLELGGLTGTVFEFYINQRSGVTVLGIDFKDVTLKARNVVFRYHKRGQEPTLTNTTTSELFPSFSITTVFKGVDKIKLSDSESVAFVNVPPIVNMGPEAGISPDPTIAARYAEFRANLYVSVQEAFLTNAPFYTGSYIQNVLCDFGLKLN